MLFNSFAFAVFLPVVYLLYWAVAGRSVRWQNALLLVASYVFYGWWDWRFLTLIFVSSLVDYRVGLQMQDTNAPRRRRALLGLSLAANLGMLGVCKYFNFFIDSFAGFLSFFGLHPHVHALHIVLPVGISFYTFQTLSYTIDIYRREIKPSRDPVAFFAFVSFFPQLVAGPIERARNLLPQFTRERSFDASLAADGARQILWGLFKKVVIADRLAAHVERIYGGYQNLDGSVLVVGTVFFAIQIYCDFSGYSDIAIGTARLFGFRLMRNFAYPYFARDIAEFWRRWHISLSSWFRDYVYIPLGGSRQTRMRRMRNILITFTVCGFWHGANWTFVVWGFLNALYYIPLIFSNRQARHKDTVAEGRWLPSPAEFGKVAVTFTMTLFAWIFFRADSVAHAGRFIGHMVSHASFAVPAYYLKPLALGGTLLAVEWFQRTKQHGLEIDGLPAPARWLVYYAVLGVLFMYGNTGHVPFIYFQF